VRRDERRNNERQKPKGELAAGGVREGVGAGEEETRPRGKREIMGGAASEVMHGAHTAGRGGPWDKGRTGDRRRR